MITKPIILVLFTWLSIFGFVYEWIERDTHRASLRDVFLMTSMAWGVILVGMIEAFSLFHLLQRQLVFFFWGAVLVLCLVGLIILRWIRTGKNFRSFFSVHIRSNRQNGAKSSILYLSVLCLTVFQVVTLAMVAYQYVPSNWDSMTYHLARVMHWIQNQSVAFYATNIDRQVQMPPFAEYAILNLQIMFNGDQYANLVQWFAMLISVIGVSSIAAKIGANRVQQAISALLCAFIPMGILQATTTQNDYVLAACIVCFISFMLSLIENPGSAVWIIGSGIALGLATLTKSTAYAFIFPFAAIFGIWYLIKNRIHAVSHGVVILLIALVINAGHFSRNYQLYRTPLGPSQAYQNGIVTPAVVASNLIRNTALHVVVKTRFEAINVASGYAIGWLRLLHQFTNLSPIDPRTSLDNTDVFANSVSYISTSKYYSEDYAGNFIHFLLILITLIAAALGFNQGEKKTHVWLMIVGLSLAFLLFCTLFKWQIWGSRLQLSLFVVWCTVIPILLFQSEKWFIQVIPILLSLFLINWTFNNIRRPIDVSASYATQDRAIGYFSGDMNNYKQWLSLTQNISNTSCNNIGLAIGLDSWEYPLWAMLQMDDHQSRIEHIAVNNATEVFEDPGFKPCAILTEGNNIPDGTHFILVNSQPYQLFLNTKYVKKPARNPKGFTTYNGLVVLLGQGWYDYEPGPGLRWMNGRGNFWIYADKQAIVSMKLRAFLMNVNQGFGSKGVLDIAINQKDKQIISITAGSPVELALELNQGFNFVELKLESGDFIPKLVDPNNSDTRSLGVALYPIELSYK